MLKFLLVILFIKSVDSDMFKCLPIYKYTSGCPSELSKTVCGIDVRGVQTGFRTICQACSLKHIKTFALMAGNCAINQPHHRAPRNNSSQIKIQTSISKSRNTTTYRVCMNRTLECSNTAPCQQLPVCNNLGIKFKSPCQACKNSQTKYYTLGQCDQNKKFVDKKPQELFQQQLKKNNSSASNSSVSATSNSTNNSKTNVKDSNSTKNESEQKPIFINFGDFPISYPQYGNFAQQNFVGSTLAYESRFNPLIPKAEIAGNWYPCPKNMTPQKCIPNTPVVCGTKSTKLLYRTFLDYCIACNYSGSGTGMDYYAIGRCPQFHWIDIVQKSISPANSSVQINKTAKTQNKTQKSNIVTVSKLNKTEQSSNTKNKTQGITKQGNLTLKINQVEDKPRVISNTSKQPTKVSTIVHVQPISKQPINKAQEKPTIPLPENSLPLKQDSKKNSSAKINTNITDKTSTSSNVNTTKNKTSLKLINQQNTTTKSRIDNISNVLKNQSSNSTKSCPTYQKICNISGTVCGFFNDGYRQEQFRNACGACKHPKVIRFSAGECPPQKTPYVQYEIIPLQDPNLPTFTCSMIQKNNCVQSSRLCGVTKGNLLKSFESICKACNDSSITKYYRVACQQLTLMKINATQKLEYIPLPPVIVPEFNYLYAKKFPNVNIYAYGTQKVMPCGEIRNSAVCKNLFYGKVCGYWSSKNYITYNSICEACSEVRVLGYSYGPCGVGAQKDIWRNNTQPKPLQCDYPISGMGSCNLKPAPVCGKINQYLCRSYLNKCLACNHGVTLNFITEGGCYGVNFTAKVLLNQQLDFGRFGNQA